MDYDDILGELGEFKKYQITTYILISIPILFSGANSFSYVFTAGIPSYRCFIPECDDILTPTYDAPWIRWTTPDKSTNQIVKLNSNYCNRFVVNKTISNGTCFEGLFTNQIETCNEWVFDGTERTIINDWNLKCPENQWKLSLVATSHFAGELVGSILFGTLADRYGRKRIFISSTILMGFFGCAQAISSDFVTFVILKFLNALMLSGIYPSAFTICVEMAGVERREMAGMILNYVYALGEATLALVAWYTKNWVVLQLMLSAPAMLFFVYAWIIPESVRWLLVNKRRNEAKQIISEAAKINNVTLSQSLLASFEEESSTEDDKLKDRCEFLTVFKSISKRRKFMAKLAIIYFIWFAASFVYYGLSLNSINLNGDKYFNFALVSLVEIPACCIAWIGIRKFGRRWSLAGSLLLCGLTCVLTLLAPADASLTVGILFLLGKSGVASAFAVVYFHTAELLPTIIRSSGMSSASTMARTGALLAPSFTMLGIFMKSLPMLMFGGLAVLAGILSLRLPETLGTKLPETLNEAESIQ